MNLRPGVRHVLIAQPIDPVATPRLESIGFDVRTAPSSDPRVILGEVGWADALIVRNFRVDAHMLSVARQLKVIAVHGVGTDSIDLEAATKYGIVVFNTPDSNYQSVAEHTMALVLALAKRLVVAREGLLAGDYAVRYRAEPFDLDGKTIGLVGFGRVGRAVGQLASAFGMRVIVFDPSLTGPDVLPPGYHRAAELDELLAGADVVSLHVPLTPETRGMINARSLSLMKRSAMLINTARGALVDERALEAALRLEQIAGAGLDVFTVEPVPANHPLLRLDQVVATPHVAGASGGALRRAAIAIVEGIQRASEGDKPRNLVNPTAWLVALARIRGLPVGS